jgi:putative ABC transport system permease protein
MLTIWQDLRFAGRTFVKTPGFTVVALLTLALGIGANSAIYSVISAVLLKGLPYPNADRLVFLSESLPKSELNVSWPDFVDWQAQNQVFEQMAAFQAQRVNITGGDQPKSLPAGWVSCAFFPLLGAKPILGRTFSDQDEKPGAPPAVVLSYGFWRNELKGDPTVLGKEITIEHGVFSVIGVLAPDYQFKPWDLYLPIGLRSKESGFANRANHPGLLVLAAMRPGVSLERVRADMKTIMDRLAQAFPESNRNETAKVVPMAERMLGGVRTDLLMLLGVVAFVLLIACANVAHLALARATARQREFAIRAAIGASRDRLMRQMFAESTLLSLLGGAAGLLLAYWSLPPLVRLYPAEVPGLKEAHLDSGVLLFTLGVCLLAGGLFGLAPMLQAARSGLNRPLQGGAGRRVRSTLFVAEIAIALALTVCAGLLLRSLAAVLDVNPGFRADHLLALDVVHSSPGPPLSHLRFFEQALDRIVRQPGVESASAVMCPPLANTCWTSPYTADGQTAPPAMQRSWTALNMVTPGYFQTMRMQLLEGRLFTQADDARSPHVAIVNQTLARRLWPQGEAAGKRLHVMYAAGQLLDVVGVIADVKQFNLESPATAEVYVPAAQMPVNFMTIVVRTSTDPATLARGTMSAIQSVEKDQPASRITPMTKVIAEKVARRKFSAFLLGLFSALALVLAMVGVAGVMAYTVAQRTREFGIRMALGAQPGQVSRLVLGHGLRLASLGVAIGVTVAWGLTRLLAKLLFGVKSHDPLTFGAVTVLLAGAAMAACFLPARRASRVDPLRALRYE